MLILLTIVLATDKSFSPKLTCIHNFKIAVNFEENYIKQDKVSFGHKNVMSVFIAYEVNIKSHDLNTDFTLSNHYCRKMIWLVARSAINH